VQAWEAVDALESVAALCLRRCPCNVRQAWTCRPSCKWAWRCVRKVGIDTLERGLKLPALNRSQEQLRSYAQNALRRTQQRLLAQVLKRAERRPTRPRRSKW
jgi:glutamate dehydrogenase